MNELKDSTDCRKQYVMLLILLPSQVYIVRTNGNGSIKTLTKTLRHARAYILMFFFVYGYKVYAILIKHKVIETP